MQAPARVKLDNSLPAARRAEGEQDEPIIATRRLHAEAIVHPHRGLHLEAWACLHSEDTA
jgi:hypothetical protein